MSFPKPEPTAGDAGELLWQRDLARVCGLLAVAIALVAVGKDQAGKSAEVERVRQAVQQHREILATHEKLLQEMDRAVVVHQEAVTRLQAAKRVAH